MTYEIIFSDFADKQLSKLPLIIQNRIVQTIKRCRVRPYAHVKKLVDSSFFRLRIGEYRAILDIQDSKLVILVIKVGHRKKIYKK
ncbi:MAG: mRNA interferase RelE/StbE [Candidatus Woesearchaeota archaeon]|jgi:mRNA interferase RelE/StbE